MNLFCLYTVLEVDAPPVVLETAKATVAVQKVSELSGAAMEVPGGAAIAFPAIDLGGGADIKVVAFKGNPYASSDAVECTEPGVPPNCKEKLSAATSIPKSLK